MWKPELAADSAVPSYARTKSIDICGYSKIWCRLKLPTWPILSSFFECTVQQWWYQAVVRLHMLSLTSKTNRCNLYFAHEVTETPWQFVGTQRHCLLACAQSISNVGRAIPFWCFTKGWHCPYPEQRHGNIPIPHGCVNVSHQYDVGLEECFPSGTTQMALS